MLPLLGVVAILLAIALSKPKEVETILSPLQANPSFAVSLSIDPSPQPKQPPNITHLFSIN